MAESKANFFLLHKENQTFLKTKKGKPKIDLGPIWFFIAFSIIGILLLGLFIFFMSYALDEYAVLAQSRDTISATVIEKWTDTDADGADTHNIRYEYVVDGTTYTDMDMISSSDYNRYENGTMIEITYSPAQPTISDTDYSPLGMLLAVGGLAIAFAVMVGLLILMILRSMTLGRLIREGRILKGIIESSSRDKDSDGDITLKIKYTFKSPMSGKTLQKKETSQFDQHQDNTVGRPEPGTPVVVLYMNDGLSRLL